MRIKGVSGSTLKLMAVCFMAMEHFGRIVIERGILMTLPRGAMSDRDFAFLESMEDVLIAIGRMAFPIFCFFLVEGFLHTKHLKKYVFHLLLFAIISEPVYDLAFYGTGFTMEEQNVLFELLLCLVMMILQQRILQMEGRVKWLFALFIAICAGYMAEVLHLDGGLFGVALVSVFYLFSGKRVTRVFAAALVIIAASCYRVGGGFEFSFSNVLDVCVAMELVSLVLLNFYNHTRGFGWKYFFYLFYPLHLLLFSQVTGVLLEI